MSALGDYWKSVWDAIVTEVKKVSDLAETTFLGEKKTPVDPKSAYVVPGTIPITAFSPTLSKFLIPFEIGIMNKDDEMVEGMKEAMNLAGQVYDQIVDDRKLGGLVDNLEVQIQPYWRGKMGLERHWVGLIVTCERIRI